MLEQAGLNVDRFTEGNPLPVLFASRPDLDLLGVSADPAVLAGQVTPAAHQIGQDHRAERPSEVGQRVTQLRAQAAASWQVDQERLVAPIGDGAQRGDGAGERGDRGRLERGDRREQVGEAGRVDAPRSEAAQLRGGAPRPVAGSGRLLDEKRASLRERALDQRTELGDGPRHRRQGRGESGVRPHSDSAPRRSG